MGGYLLSRAVHRLTMPPLRSGALLLTLALAIATSFARLNAQTALQAKCAAFDLHLLEQIEEAGRSDLVQPIHLFATVEALMQARKLCESGHAEQAIRMYEALDLGIVKTWALRR